MSLDDPQVEDLVRRLAAATGETPKEAMLRALEERLVRCRRQSDTPRSRADVLATIIDISRRGSALPDLDQRAADEILAYNAAGVPD